MAVPVAVFALIVAVTVVAVSRRSSDSASAGGGNSGGEGSSSGAVEFDPNDLDRTGRWLAKGYEVGRFTPEGNDLARDQEHKRFIKAATEAMVGKRVNWTVNVDSVTRGGTIYTSTANIQSNRKPSDEGYSLITRPLFFYKDRVDKAFQTDDLEWAATVKTGDRVRLSGTVVKFDASTPEFPPYHFRIHLGNDALISRHQ